MRHLLHISIAAIPLILGGCASLPNLSAPPASAIALSIEPSDTEAREVLRCVGRKLEALLPSDQPPFVISVGSFKHAGLHGALSPQEVCLDCTTAIEASLTQISPLIRYTDIARHTLPGPWITKLPIPNLFLEGSLLIQERVPRSESTNWDLSLTLGLLDMRLSRKHQESLAALELDMNALLPNRISDFGLAAPLRIAFDRSASVQTSLAASIVDIAVGGERVSRRVTSNGPALRLGIAHQLAQIVGRWQALPGYWTCTGGKLDEQVREERLGHFRLMRASLGEAATVGFLQELLAYNGHLLPSKTAQLDEPTVAALSAFMQRRGQRFDAQSLESTYWELMLGAVDQPQSVLQAARAWEQRFSKPASAPEALAAPALPHADGQRQPGASRQKADHGQANEILEGEAVEQAQPLVQLSLTSAKPGKTAYRRGERIDLVVQPSADAHVYCFLRDDHRKIMRIFPNRYIKNSLIRTGQPLLVPGNMKFEFIASDNGNREEVMCFATHQDVMAMLPASIQSSDFQPIAGVDDLAELRAAFQRAGGKTFGVASYAINVH